MSPRWTVCAVPGCPDQTMGNFCSDHRRLPGDLHNALEETVEGLVETRRALRDGSADDMAEIRLRNLEDGLNDLLLEDRELR